MNAHKPEALGIGAKRIAAIADSVIEQLGYTPGADLEPVVQRLGGRISHVDFWGGSTTDSGSIEVKDNSFEIRLALATGPLRDRFTIAHELGHYILHYLYANQVNSKKIKWLVAERFGNDLAEKEANAFAAAFLMPEKAYRTLHEETNGNHFVISQKFQVSAAASKVRASALGLE